MRLVPVLGTLLLCVVAAAAGQGATDPSPPMAPPSPPCRLEGEVTADAGTKLFTGRDGGPAVAELGTVASHLTIEDLPERDGSGRARVTLGTGKEHPAVRMEGWLALSRLPIYAREDIPVVASHVAIVKGERVEVSRDPKGLGADLHAPRYLGVHGTPRCDDLSLELVEAELDAWPADAEVLEPSGSRLQLFDGPGGSPIFAVTPKKAVDRPSLRVVSRNEGWVRVVMRDQLAIDAWARRDDLTEVRSLGLIGGFGCGGCGLGLWSSVTVKRDAEIRLVADADASVVGFAEQGLSMIELGRDGPWVEVKPVIDTVHPPPAGHWWIRASDL